MASDGALEHGVNVPRLPALDPARPAHARSRAGERDGPLPDAQPDWNADAQFCRIFLPLSTMSPAAVIEASPAASITMFLPRISTVPSFLSVRLAPPVVMVTSSPAS